MNLEAWLDNTKKLIALFTLVDFSHVYREHIMRADTLSKEGLHMALGHLTLMEICEGELFGEVVLQLF